MFLAEAIREKDYLKNSIMILRNHICELISVKNSEEVKSNSADIIGRQEELEDLYKKYRQFSVTIERAKAKVNIKVNNTDLSLIDAMSILKIMKDKNEDIDAILTRAYEENKLPTSIVCVNIDRLFDKILENLLDIKTLESEIEFALWGVEV